MLISLWGALADWEGFGLGSWSYFSLFYVNINFSYTVPQVVGSTNAGQNPVDCELQ